MEDKDLRKSILKQIKEFVSSLEGYCPTYRITDIYFCINGIDYVLATSTKPKEILKVNLLEYSTLSYIYKTKINRKNTKSRWYSTITPSGLLRQSIDGHCSEAIKHYNKNFNYEYTREL